MGVGWDRIGNPLLCHLQRPLVISRLEFHLWSTNPGFTGNASLPLCISKKTLISMASKETHLNKSSGEYRHPTGFQLQTKEGS